MSPKQIQSSYTAFTTSGPTDTFPEATESADVYSTTTIQAWGVPKGRPLATSTVEDSRGGFTLVSLRGSSAQTMEVDAAELLAIYAVLRAKFEGQ